MFQTTNQYLGLGLLSLLAFTPGLRADNLTGRVVDNAGNGVGGVTVDPNGGATAVVTDPAGFFNISLLGGTYDVAFLPPNSSLAPIELINITVSGVRNLGNIVLLPGFDLSGTVTTTTGLPVANSDINVYEQATGNKLFTPGDNTDPTGQFSVVVPAGTYRVRASSPPLATLVAQELRGVTVAAATNVGTIQLPPGFVVTGRVLSASSGLPIAGVDLDADDALSGERIITPGDDTDSFGNYRLILPYGMYHLSFDPPPGAFVAQQFFNLIVLSNTVVHTISLETGFSITATVLGPAGPVAGADIDVYDSMDNELYLANDDTDGAGVFSVAVPTGTWRVTIEPPETTGLVGTRTTLLNVSTPQTLPNVMLQTGVTLSGTIVGPTGPEAGVDLDVVDPITGEDLVISGDYTAADGSFSMAVPVGTWDIHVHTPRTSRAQGEVVAGLAVTGPTVLNRTLPLSPMDVAMTPFGIPTASAGGVFPLLAVTFQNQTSGALLTQVEIAVRNAAGSEIAVFPAIPLTLPPGIPATLTGLFLPVPNVPASWRGVQLRYVTRFRDPVTGVVQDADAAPFVVQ